MSLLQTFTVKTFHDLNPDWDIIVHLIKQRPDQLGKNIYVPDYAGNDYFHLVVPFVHVSEIDLEEEGIGTDKYPSMTSDIIRLKMLYKWGGVYSDFDVIWLKPMSEFYRVNCIGDPFDFDTTDCFFNFWHGHHNNSNIVSFPGTEYLKFFMEEQRKVKPPYSHQAINTDLSNRLFPDYHTEIKMFPKILFLKYNVFYPYSIMFLEQLYQRLDLSPLLQEPMAIHWFNGHRLSQDYVKNLNKECSMHLILKNLKLL
jgi:hypothetical protein